MTCSSKICSTSVEVEITGELSPPCSLAAKPGPATLRRRALTADTRLLELELAACVQRFVALIDRVTLRIAFGVVDRPFVAPKVLLRACGLRMPMTWGRARSSPVGFEFLSYEPQEVLLQAHE